VRETGAESEAGRRPPEVQFPVVVARETDGERRVPDEPRPAFRRAEARLPVDRWPVELGVISGDSGRKSGDFQGQFSGEISGEAQRCFPVNSSNLKQKFLMISCAFLLGHC
jgi:hypothetical protein